MKQKLLLIAVVFLAAILRLYWLGLVPPALYWDEASLGYNAFSIAKTARDEHGVFLPHDSFAAFGDYKPIGYIYAVAGFVKLLGLSEISVRLPSAMAGVLLSLVTYFLVKELKFSRKTSLAAALFVAVSPWSLQMSRAGFEANLATFFSTFGVLLFLRRWPLSAVFFVLAMYTFNSHRVFVPLLVGALSLIFVRDLIKSWKKSLIFYVLFFLLLLPLVPHLLSTEGKLRFNEVTWLNNLSLVETSNRAIADNNGVWWAKIVFNRRVFYVLEFSRHYLDHFRPDFLFISGDINPRLSVRSFGEMYWLDLPLFLIGLFWLLRRRNKATAVLLSWLLLAPIPAAMARETPHALRVLNVLPVPMIISAVGLVKVPKILGAGAALVLAILVFLYLQSYYLVYPVKFANEWQYGYKQMVEYVSRIQNNYDYVSVTNHYGRPYIYFLFYNQYSPEKYWRNRLAFKDQFGFWSVAGFDKYVFDGREMKGKGLFVRSPEEPMPGHKEIKTLKNFVFYE